MRIFSEPGLSFRSPIKVIVQDDELELPDVLSALRVFYIRVEDGSGNFKAHLDEGSRICFSKEDDEFLMEQQQKQNPVFGSTLEQLILECQLKAIEQIVIR